MAALKKQKGGTVFGFVVGLITGLVIAVVVVFMVTKTPIPFANRKDNKRENPPTPASVATPAPAPASDPNQSLYDKNPAKSPTTPAVSADHLTNTPPVQPKQQTTPAVATPTPAPAPAPASAASQSTSEDKTVYYLQAGAFRNKSEAENMRGNLALLGFESHIVEGSSQSGNIYRVRLGPYKSNAVNGVQSRLKQNGINTTTTRVAKQ